MPPPPTFVSLPGCRRYWWAFGLLAALVGNGIYFAWRMGQEGHWITGMSNQVVWGAPHVFAILLVLAASGVLNVATLSSVFGRAELRPWGRLSGLLAVTLLLGGLGVLVLDLGRPERLVIAMTHYNFKSLFAWNVFLYIGFMLVVIAYLYVQFEPRLHRHVRPAGLLAFAWRMVLTSGTGLIFGLLVARETWDSALFALLFIALSLVFGAAVFIIFPRGPRAVFDEPLRAALARTLVYFILAAAFVTVLLHLAKLYNARARDAELFLLFTGGIYPALFWAGYTAAGTLLPLWLLLGPGRERMRNLVAAAWLVLAGGVCHLYVIIIGAQAWPLDLFPGLRESSGFFDGVIAGYTPGVAELSLGAGGVALSLLLSLVVMRVLPFLPEPDSGPRAAP